MTISVLWLFESNFIKFLFLFYSMSRSLEHHFRDYIVLTHKFIMSMTIQTDYLLNLSVGKCCCSNEDSVQRSGPLAIDPTAFAEPWSHWECWDVAERGRASSYQATPASDGHVSFPIHIRATRHSNKGIFTQIKPFTFTYTFVRTFYSCTDALNSNMLWFLEACKRNGSQDSWCPVSWTIVTEPIALLVWYQ